MSRTLQDQFIDDDEEETCPLCVEEFDLTDKGFRPCPCGYQICQFCYHNVKNNMNGLCPACRRPYNDKDIQYKVITSEETAAHKARQADKQKKNQAVLQKEKAKAEAQHLSRKHLAGLRVMQKNLVYVTGLSPTSQEDQLLATLRGDQYFGQYGKIIKIVVSKARDPSHPHSVGVYVTYERKEDAESCITAVNGAKNGDRTLRAQFGTTKYCSAYLRNETCTNRNCMFLHEAGDGNESYSRADLSALNAGSSQHEGGRPPPPQSQQPIASATQPMARQLSSDAPHSPPNDRPALPSTASWASKPPLQQGRTESRSTSGTIESPAVTNAVPAQFQPEPPVQSQPPAPAEISAPVAPKQVRKPKPKAASPLANLLKYLTADDFKFIFSVTSLSEIDLNIVKNYPPLFDHDGGAKRRQRKIREEEHRRMEQEAQTFQQQHAVDQDDNPEMSGSLQLGGEPEDRQILGQPTGAIRPPGQDGILDQRFQFGGVSSPGLGDRGLTPQQQNQLLLQTMKGSNEQGSYPGGFQNSIQQPASSAPPGHHRNVSRYSFANDSSSATAVKPVANSKLLNQQSSIMPQASNNQFGTHQDQQRLGNNQQFYTSNVQGPPPGLKTTGTPPVSGGMTFGQGHGFATGGLQYGASSAGRQNANEELMRQLLRGRDNGMDAAAKRESHYISPPNHYNSTTAVYQPTANGFVAGQQFPFEGPDKQRSKKKSKKHGRHGNTSSSVSSGADIAGAEHPHMLQARLQQSVGGLSGFSNQTAGAAAGGMYLNNSSGLYGSVETDFPPLGLPSRTASISINEGEASRQSTPPVPPGFEQHLNESRRATPTIPPGLAKPTALPNLSDGPISRPGSRASLRRQASTQQILPALPLRPGTPAARPATPARIESKDGERAVEDDTPTKPSKVSKGKTPLIPHEQTDETVKPAEPQPAGPDIADAEEATSTVKVDGLDHAKQQDQPSKDAPDNPDLSKSNRSPPYALQPAPKGQATVESSNLKAAPVTPIKSWPKKDDTQKRKHPGKLDITAAVTKRDQTMAADATPVEASTSAQSVDTGTPAKFPELGTPGKPPFVRAVSQTPSVMAKPESPAGSIVSPIVKTMPRTLRVVQTPKTETPPSQMFSVSPAAIKLPSRKPSIASINPPGTPSSEQVSISDNISLTSTSMSRANSPPPSRVGSAPVRTKTKSQLKKERQERGKATVQIEETAKAALDEPAQEAILSRKKKAKKEKEPKARVKAISTTDTMPTASRSVSPKPKAEEVTKVEQATAYTANLRDATSTRTTDVTPPQQPLMPAPHEPSPPPTPTLTPSFLFAELKAHAPEVQKCIDSLFRTPNNAHLKPTQPITPKDLQNPHFWKHDSKINLSKDEVDALLNGSLPAINYGGADGRLWDRGMVTGSGAHIRALTAELEQRFLDLEKVLRDIPSELRFHASKPQNETQFPTLDLEALKRQFENAGGRGVSVMEQMVQDGSTMKKGAFLVDEASKYVNEFVMPPTPPMASAQLDSRGGGSVQGGAVGVGGYGAGGKQQVLQQQQVVEPVSVSLEIADRQLLEARRAAEEKESALRKVIKKNRRLLGLG